MQVKKKSNERTKLISELDKWFSIYIRTRYASDDGYVQCFTCGKVGHWKTMDCGHYWSRRYYSVRWDEINCQVQCKSCNIFKEGNKPAFERALRRKYGDNVIEQLEIQKSNVMKIDTFTLSLLIEKYKNLCKNVNKSEKTRGKKTKIAIKI